MKKTLIALAALAVAGTAFAQSSVTMSGTFGAGYQSYYKGADGTGSGTAATTPNKGFAQTDASVKFAVVEDLGGGMKASADAQFTMNGSRGGNATKEDSNLKLSGAFGTVGISNTRTSNAAINANVFASWMPTTAFYAGVDQRVVADVFSYTSPELAPGLTVGYAVAEVNGDGNNTSAKQDKISIVSASYANGPLAAVVAFKSPDSKVKATYAALSTVVKSTTEVAATYDLGVAKFGLGYSTKRTEDDKALTSYGVSVPVGALTVGVNGAKRGEEKFYDAGVIYALSKRTSVNVMFGKITSVEGVGSAYAGTTYNNYNGKQTRFGIKHNF